MSHQWDVSHGLMEAAPDEDLKRVGESHEDICGGRAFSAMETAAQRPWGQGIFGELEEQQRDPCGWSGVRESSKARGVSVHGGPCGLLERPWAFTLVEWDIRAGLLTGSLSDLHFRDVTVAALLTLSVVWERGGCGRLRVTAVAG